jgi:hypothetical protein
MIWLKVHLHISNSAVNTEKIMKSIWESSGLRYWSGFCYNQEQVRQQVRQMESMSQWPASLPHEIF